ncbi:MAG: large-conductance mechanosensitive channel protein MscL [Bryobacteraceae bacterium]
MAFVSEFKAFISRGSVVDLAVGVIIGGAFGAIVTALVNDIIMPPIGMLTSGVDFKDLFVALDGNHYASLAAAKAAKPHPPALLMYGDFVNTILDFLIIAFCIFLLIKALSKLMPKPVPPPPPPGPTLDQQLLVQIRDLLAKGALPSA